MGLYKTITSETLKGKSVGRILFNHELRSVRINGRVLDLGSGKIKPSYYRFLNIAENSEIITANISTEMNPHILADLEKPFPLKSDSFDCVLVFNLLEHIYDYKNLLSESHRVLRNNGELYGVVPFLINVHSDPYDYFRYTKTALLRLLKEAGFKDVDIKTLGHGPFLSAYSQIESILPRIIRLLLLFICISFDSLLMKTSGRATIQATEWPLWYVFACTKRA